MAGTSSGGKKAATTSKRRYGENWYAKIGSMGGRKGHTGGFAAHPELARECGRKGGKVSKRRPGTTAIIQTNLPEMVRLAAEGLTYAEIGRRMGLSWYTVSAAVRKAKATA